MSKLMKSLSLTLALALLVAFASFTPAQAADNGRRGGVFGWINDDNQLPVDRHLEMYDIGNANIYGMDSAYNTVFGTDRDADFRSHNFVPETYGLSGNYQRYSNN